MRPSRRGHVVVIGGLILAAAACAPVTPIVTSSPGAPTSIPSPTAAVPTVGPTLRPTLVPLPSQPSTSLVLQGALVGTTGPEPGGTTCTLDSATQQLMVYLPPIAVGTGFAVTIVAVPASEGQHPIGTAAPSAQTAAELVLQVLTNPAGGGGGPTWTGTSGTVTVTAAGPFGDPNAHPVVLGTVDATLHQAGAGDVELSGSWGCVV